MRCWNGLRHQLSPAAATALGLQLDLTPWQTGLASSPSGSSSGWRLHGERFSCSASIDISNTLRLRPGGMLQLMRGIVVFLKKAITCFVPVAQACCSKNTSLLSSMTAQCHTSAGASTLLYLLMSNNQLRDFFAHNAGPFLVQGHI